jgi:7,8-dihydropterin-6-yl-methyl-4-(beta-D-ribofuranosyl)aminobenzene 5'-phosphate synthase
MKQVKVPVYVGTADAFNERRFINGAKNWSMGALDKAALGDRLVESPKPVVVAGGALLSGTIAQVTPFEKVPAFLKVKRGGQLVQDDMSHELALGFRVKGKGLVVVTSCSHSGVINTVKHLMGAAKEDRLLAVIGGMHLTSAPDPVVTSTIDALAELKPTYVAPLHCTGNRAVEQLTTKLKAAEVPPSVGTRYTF